MAVAALANSAHNNLLTVDLFGTQDCSGATQQQQIRTGQCMPSGTQSIMITCNSTAVYVKHWIESTQCQGQQLVYDPGEYGVCYPFGVAEAVKFVSCN